MTIKAQLAESISLNQLPLFVPKTDWWFEQKFDGHRLLMHVQDSQVTPINRRGNVIKVPAAVQSEFESGLFEGEWVFDGELLSDLYVVFDLLQVPDRIYVSTPYKMRRHMLDLIMPVWQPYAVIQNEVARTVEEKKSLVERVLEFRSEGLMVKQADSPYFPGLRTDTMLKCKFVKTADVVVTIVGRQGKNSVAMAVFDDDGNEVDVGACTVTSRTLSRLNKGDVIEVRYLYATEEHKLFQPAFIGFRTDKAPEECSINQLVQTDKGVVTF